MVTDAVVRMVDARRDFRRGDETVVALDGVSLDIDPGEMVAVVGPSGCGKSTMLSLITAVDRPTGGTVEVCGTELAKASEKDMLELRRRAIGAVFQAFHLIPHLTVEENVALQLALGGRHEAARVRELLERVGLGHRRGHYPSELSGGEQQRTAVARALVHRPRVVAADEPTGNLDSRTGGAVLELLDELRGASGTALVLATHDARLASAADRVVHLADGRVVDG